MVADGLAKELPFFVFNVDSFVKGSLWALLAFGLE